jgi:predicted metal-binding membrane protein
MASRAATLADVLKRDRLLVLSAVLGMTALAWFYLIDMADMQNMSGMMAAAMNMAPWDATGFFLMFLMWMVMMVGMMLPGAAPMILLFATINRKMSIGDAPYVPTALFTLGYLLVWTAFSLLATILQAALQQATLLSPMLVSTSGVLGGTLFITAGFYQWTPLKRACLDKCRSPLDFILFRWRSGPVGALQMGIEHGSYCLGCCWALMVLLFVGGVMNLLWVAAITVVVLTEKLARGGEWIAHVGGAAMLAVGMYLALA